MATILYFGPARELTGCSSEQMSIDGRISVSQLWNQLLERHPALAGCRDSSRLAVGMDYADDSSLIDDACEIAIIPPVAGG